jgi:hypothetical protein
LSNKSRSIFLFDKQKVVVCFDKQKVVVCFLRGNHARDLMSGGTFIQHTGLIHVVFLLRLSVENLNNVA